MYIRDVFIRETVHKNGWQVLMTEVDHDFFGFYCEVLFMTSLGEYCVPIG